MNQDIVGNKEQIEYLEHVVKTENISHAYVFTGVEGIGKRKIAENFAKKILKTDNLVACADFKFIEKEEDAKEIQADIIRENLVNNVYQKPIVSERKVYIINDAHKMNDTAQNILLKTLEEPPKYVVIILIATSIDTLLPTIKSRLKEVVFEQISKKELKEYAKKYLNVSSIDNLDDVLEYSNGSIGKLIKLVKPESIEKIKILDEFIFNLENKETIKLFTMQKSKMISFKEEDTLDYIQFRFFSKYRNTLEYKYLNCVECIEKTKLKIKKNCNEEMAIDNMIIEIIRYVS